MLSDLPHMIQSVLAQTADTIASIQRPHPIRVGIDGPSASGKTTFATKLADTLRERKRSVIRASIDGFHNPPEIRYQKGDLCPTGYLEDSFDKQAVIENLLGSLGPNGDLAYRESKFDFRSNQTTQAKTQKASPDSILVFEGVLLFCDTLGPHFDFRIYVDTAFDRVLKRALSRDSHRLGGENATLEKYNKRYIPGQKEYIRRHTPHKTANIVINNNDFLKPLLHVGRSI